MTRNIRKNLPRIDPNDSRTAYDPAVWVGYTRQTEVHLSQMLREDLFHGTTAAFKPRQTIGPVDPDQRNFSQSAIGRVYATAGKFEDRAHFRESGETFPHAAISDAAKWADQAHYTNLNRVRQGNAPRPGSVPRIYEVRPVGSAGHDTNLSGGHAVHAPGMRVTREVRHPAAAAWDKLHWNLPLGHKEHKEIDSLDDDYYVSMVEGHRRKRAKDQINHNFEVMTAPTHAIPGPSGELDVRGSVLSHPLFGEQRRAPGPPGSQWP